MDKYFVNVFKKDDKYYSHIDYSGEYYKEYFESKDLFLCLTQLYAYIKLVCDRERLYINKDTLIINLFQQVYNEERERDELIIMCSKSYKDIYNIIF